MVLVLYYYPAEIEIRARGEEERGIEKGDGRVGVSGSHGSWFFA